MKSFQLWFLFTHYSNKQTNKIGRKVLREGAFFDCRMLVGLLKESGWKVLEWVYVWAGGGGWGERDIFWGRLVHPLEVKGCPEDPPGKEPWFFVLPGDGSPFWKPWPNPCGARLCNPLFQEQEDPVLPQGHAHLVCFCVTSFVRCLCVLRGKNYFIQFFIHLLFLLIELIGATLVNKII